MTSQSDAGKRPVAEAIDRRRSIRKYLSGPVASELLLQVTRAGLMAPAPHHSRPWRFVVITSETLRRRLAEAMAARWAEDLRRVKTSEHRISELTKKSVLRLTEVPALIVGCIDLSEVRTRNDSDLDQCEWIMAQFSLGAAMENIMLAAGEERLGTCWIASPLYCPDVVGKVLEIPSTWTAQALITIGYADPTYVPSARAKMDPNEFILFK